MLKLSLLSITLISWAINAQEIPDTSCPAGTTPLGPLGTRAKSQRALGARRFTIRDPRGQPLPNVGSSDCLSYCKSINSPLGEVNSFMYLAYIGLCYCFQSTDPRMFYRPNYPTNREPYPYDNVVSCALTNRKILCPVGTSQVGEAGEYEKGGTTLAVLENRLSDIEECEKECCDTDGCGAFLFDNDPNICSLYGSTDDAQERAAGVDTENNIVLCELDADGDECPLEGECPAGTNQVGEIGQYISAETVDVEYYKTIEECAALCRCNEDCITFLFDDNIMTSGQPRSFCRLAQRTRLITDSRTRQPRMIPSNSPYAQQIACQIEQCPSASSPIQTNGIELNPRNRITIITGTKVATIQLCQYECKNTDGCVAYTYDYDLSEPRSQSGRYTVDNPSDNRCYLYSSATPYRYVPGLTYGDLISCALNNAAGSSALNGLWNIDYSSYGNNAENATEISSWLIYAVIGLIFVNIICLMINCWKKCNGNKGKSYKVVSMRSDDDESTDV